MGDGSGTEWNMIGSHQSALFTPALCLNLCQWEQTLSAMAQAIHRHGKQWRPVLDWHGCREMMQQQLSASGGLAAIGNIRELASMFMESTASGSVQSLQVTHPPVHPQDVELLLELNRRFPVTVLCDHFIHAETISQAACERNQTVGLLVEVNPGRHHSGVRPGLDGRDLALGISRLSGVQLKGLAANAGTILPDDPDSARRVRSVIGILSELKDIIERDGIPCESISIALEGDLTPALDSDVPTEIRTGNLFNQAHSPGPARSPISSEPILYVLTKIFSRSKLERAVLDVGMSLLGPVCGQPVASVGRTASHRMLPDVEISTVEWDQTVLELGPGSRDLIIGDIVELVPVQGVIPLQLFSELFVVNGKMVQERWQLRGGPQQTS